MDIIRQLCAFLGMVGFAVLFSLKYVWRRLRGIQFNQLALFIAALAVLSLFIYMFFTMNSIIWEMPVIDWGL